MLNIEQLPYKKMLKISYLNKEGDVEIDYVRVKDENWHNWTFCKPYDKAKDSEYLSWNGKPVKKDFSSDYLDRYGIMWVLNKTLTDEQKRTFYAPNTPKMFFTDIEVISDDNSFPEPSEAKWAVNLICTVNDTNKVLIQSFGNKRTHSDLHYVTEELNKYVKELGTTYEVVWKNYVDESEMLKDYFLKVVNKCAFMTGWNFEEFDWNYLYNRAIRLGVDVAKLFPSGKMKKTIVSKDKENFFELMLPLHRHVFDYLRVYKKWDKTIDIKENDTLDFTASEILGIKKLSYVGNLKNLMDNNYQDFVLYCCIDTCLVKLIHEKIKTTNQYVGLASLTHVEQSKAFSPVAMTESVLFSTLLIQKKLFIPEFKNPQKEDYKGAYISDAKLGFHKSVLLFDFASLYPKIMMQWNIGPDSYIGTDLTEEQVAKLTDYIKTASGSYFKRNERSVLVDILHDFYDRRKFAQNKAKGLESAVDKIRKYYEKL